MSDELSVGGWGHPHKGKRQHYFVPDKGSNLEHSSMPVASSLCRRWQLQVSSWQLPKLYPEPMGSRKYLMYPLCRECERRRGPL